MIEGTLYTITMQNPNKKEGDYRRGGKATGTLTKCTEKPDWKIKKLSKTLSWLLRHGAVESGFQLKPGGYLYVDEVLSLPQLSEYVCEDIEYVVMNNDKQRFALDVDSKTHKMKIKANQGHSIEIVESDLRPIKDASEFPIVVHGTYFKVWPMIKEQGLRRMKRTHIHFAPGVPGEAKVISGMRNDCDLLIYIDLQRAISDGLSFYVSQNNVILTPGNVEGCLDPKYFLSVKKRFGDQQISNS